MKNDEEISELINSFNFDTILEDLNQLLIKESIIDFKKENNIKLTKEEVFFD